MDTQQLDLIEFLLCERDTIVAQVARRLGSAGVAEEAVKEALLLLRCQKTPATSGNPRQYLLGIATQLGIDRLLRECAAARVNEQLTQLRRAEFTR